MYLTMPNRRRRYVLWFVFVVLGVGVWLYDYFFPVDLQPAYQAQVVIDYQGQPLRQFADANGVWRYQTDLNQVSERYLQALITYEDRWFWSHPGVNPLALLRAAYQWLMASRIVSGGSTLTMQVARLRYPHSRGMWGKLQQIVRALQLEWHFSKQDILNYYLNHVPMGGTLEGVEAASRRYFGHSAQHLTWAQASLLAGLPQAPSYFRPDRHQQRAHQQRDKVLNRLVAFQVLTAEAANFAKLEPVMAHPIQPYMSTPLLARRLKKTSSSHGLIQSFIHQEVQMALEDLLRQWKHRWPQHASAAVMVMEHGTGKVIAYAGSADFNDDSRFSHVDMVQAKRSPGSTLKPFIYGLALDQGLIHSHSLLMDVPLVFGDYRPMNFNRGFSGPVSVAQALKQSLNIPAVQVLERLKPTHFYAKLQTATGGLSLPTGATPNLSLALGGVSTSLEHLVSLYSALANNGRALVPRFSTAQTLHSRTLLSPESAWVVRKLLQEPHQVVAIKTGTSAGYKDVWALGVTAHHTIGVWVGQPDNQAMTAHQGSITAIPLFKAVAQRLPDTSSQYSLSHTQPPGVTRETICWPSGQSMASQAEVHCDVSKQAWIIHGLKPQTWMDTRQQTPWMSRPYATILKAKDSGLRVSLGCVEATQSVTFAIWPAPLQPWLDEQWQTFSRLPALDPRCDPNHRAHQSASLRLQGLADGARLKRHPSTHRQPNIHLTALGGEGQWFWFLDGELLPQNRSRLTLPMPKQGRHQVVVSDPGGHSAKIEFVVE